MLLFAQVAVFVLAPDIRRPKRKLSVFQVKCVLIGKKLHSRKSRQKLGIRRIIGLLSIIPKLFGLDLREVALTHRSQCSDRDWVQKFGGNCFAVVETNSVVLCVCVCVY